MSENQIMASHYSNNTPTLEATVPDNGALVIFYAKDAQTGFMYPVDQDNNNNDISVLKQTIQNLATSDISFTESKITIVTNNQELNNQITQSLNAYAAPVEAKNADKVQNYRLDLKDGNLSTTPQKESSPYMLANQELER